MDDVKTNNLFLKKPKGNENAFKFVNRFKF